MPGSPMILRQRLRKARCLPIGLLYRPTSDLSTPFLARPLKTAHLLRWLARALVAAYVRVNWPRSAAWSIGEGKRPCADGDLLDACTIRPLDPSRAALHLSRFERPGKKRDFHHPVRTHGHTFDDIFGGRMTPGSPDRPEDATPHPCSAWVPGEPAWGSRPQGGCRSKGQSGAPAIRHRNYGQHHFGEPNRS